ncbi:thioredoxin-like protein [Infundibulicybe gibba]|nr:thioredoxin-like protein [Infundibulicybe gibba]
MSTENPALDSSKIRVVGISPDPVAKQKAFVEKHSLNYPVLSDESGEAFKAYKIGKGMFGLTNVARVTFIIDEKGVVQDTLDATMNYGAHIKFVEKWVKGRETSTTATPAVPA